jgi:hypothetical protein
MARWKIEPTGLDVREHDYSAGFDCINLDYERSVHVTVTQTIGHPASDLVNALCAVAKLLVKVSKSDDELPPDPPPRLN